MSLPSDACRPWRLFWTERRRYRDALAERGTTPTGRRVHVLRSAICIPVIVVFWLPWRVLSPERRRVRLSRLAVPPADKAAPSQDQAPCRAWVKRASPGKPPAPGRARHQARRPLPVPRRDRPAHGRQPGRARPSARHGACRTTSPSTTCRAWPPRGAVQRGGGTTTVRRLGRTARRSCSVRSCRSRSARSVRPGGTAPARGSAAAGPRSAFAPRPGPASGRSGS